MTLLKTKNISKKLKCPPENKKTLPNTIKNLLFPGTIFQSNRLDLDTIYATPVTHDAS